MAMWDRIKDQAKGLQQAQGRGSGGHGRSGSGSGGSKAQLVSAHKA